jgi:hypothetical protein
MAASNHRVTELEDEIGRQSSAIEDPRVAGAERIDAVRRLRILTNALELIRSQPS